jgi:hypothetical protein
VVAKWLLPSGNALQLDVGSNDRLQIDRALPAFG